MTAPTPLVSVIMTVRNGAAFLRETMDALLAQTFTEFELVINDNGSTDETASLLKSYAHRDPRVRVIAIPPGAPSTFTQGIERALRAACAPFVAVNDGDDVPSPERLAMQVARLQEQPSVAVVASDYVHIDESGRYLATFTLPRSHEGLVDALQARGVIAHSSVMYRREDAIAAGGYREQFSYASDTALWVEMVRRGKRLATIPVPLIAIRQHAAQTSLMPGRKAQLYLEPLQVLTAAARLPGASPAGRAVGVVARQKLALRYGLALWQSGQRSIAVVRTLYWLVMVSLPLLLHWTGRSRPRVEDATRSEGQAR